MASLKKCCCGTYTNCRPCKRVKISIKDVLKGTTVCLTVVGLTRFKIRLKIAAFVIAIACKIGGLSCKVNE